MMKRILAWAAAVVVSGYVYDLTRKGVLLGLEALDNVAATA